MVRELPSGLFVGLNESENTIKKILAQACEAVGIKFGRDLRLMF